MALAALAAVIPTILSAQGMVSVGADVLMLPLPVALALAAFLELALVSAALQARGHVLAGRSPTADLVATWVFSAVSGVFSAAHELVGASGAWEHDPRSLLAAGVRIAAPLVACWLWHRVLVADRVRREDRPTRAEARRHRLMHRTAQAALAVSRQDTPRRRDALDRAHARLLRRVPATDDALADLATWIRVVGDVDALPQRTTATRRAPAKVTTAEPQATATTSPARELARREGISLRTAQRRLKAQVATS